MNEDNIQELQLEIVPDNVDITKLDQTKMYLSQSAYDQLVATAKVMNMPLEAYIISLLKAEIAKDLNKKAPVQE